MVTSRAPTPDLTLAHFPMDPRAREDLYFRWVDRVLRELVPSALEDVAHRDEAEELRRRLPAPIGREHAWTVFEVCRDVCHRLWPNGPVSLERELAFHVMWCVEAMASTLAEATGALRVVKTTWSEETGPGADKSLILWPFSARN